MIIEKGACTCVFTHTWYLVAKVTSGHLEHTPSAAFLLLLVLYPPLFLLAENNMPSSWRLCDWLRVKGM